MKVEIINDEDIDIYINSYHLQGIDYNAKEDLLDRIKDLILKTNDRYRLNLCGFYKIKVYLNFRIGMFLNIIKIDDNEFNNEVDFRIVLYEDEKFFLETEEYEIIDSITTKYYYNNRFYIDLDNLDDFTKYIDMGRIIYGDEVREMLSSCRYIK